MKKIFLLGSAIALTGCSMAPIEPNQALTPERVTKYATIDDLIAKSPNFREYYEIKSFYATSKNIPLNSVKIPVGTLEMFCTQKEGGVFTKVKSVEPYYMTKDSRPYAEQEGTYTCSKGGSTLWAADVKLAKISASTEGSRVAVLLGIKKIDGAKYDKELAYQLRLKRAQEASDAANKKSLEAYYQKQKDAYLAEKSARKPVTNKNIGDTICREVRVFNGDYYGFKNLYNYNNIVAGNLEEFPANGTNLKVSLLGGIDNQNKIHPGPNAKFNGINVEPGKVIWEKKSDWYLCNY